MNKTKNILVSRLTSGLGNQLFQYAFSKWLANRYNSELFFDTSWFDYFQIHQPKRKERLRKMGLNGINEYKKGITRWVMGAPTLGDAKLRYHSQRFISPILGVNYFNEYSPNRLPDFIPEPSQNRALVLCGYWQFWQPGYALGKAMGEMIRKNWVWSAGAAQVRNTIVSAPNAAFIHVRRGDYLKFGMTTLGIDYYKEAITLIESYMGTSPKWFVFSEDKSWCRNNLNFLSNSTIIDYASDDSDIEDILLMSHCRGGIIANSSYSWWGAALANQEGRPIVAPRRWNGTLESESWEIAFPDWLTL